jgi:hypothetical protein
MGLLASAGRTRGDVVAEKSIQQPPQAYVPNILRMACLRPSVQSVQHGPAIGFYQRPQRTWWKSAKNFVWSPMRLHPMRSVTDRSRL